MFFPERVVSVKPNDLVLEVGPGGGPHPRSDVFLEMRFEDDREESLQRSNTDKLVTDKPVFFYDGIEFPFDDDEFDYVICSHVIEHVPNVDVFVRELQRVAKKGYIEFPTIYYDYLYNMPTHVNFLLYKNQSVYYLPKNYTQLGSFQPVQVFFSKTLENGYTGVIKEHKEYFFQGFEWFGKIEVVQANSVAEVSYDVDRMTIAKKKKKKKWYARALSGFVK